MHSSLVLVVTASAPVGTARYSRHWVVQIPGLQAEEPVLEHVACAAAYNTPALLDDDDSQKNGMRAGTSGSLSRERRFAAITPRGIRDNARARIGGRASRSPARDRWPGRGRLPPRREDGPGSLPRGR